MFAVQTESTRWLVIVKILVMDNVNILFTRPEFKQWCIDHESSIVALKRPSLDRVDKEKHYSLDNIQVIELTDNIRKDKVIFTATEGRCHRCKETKPLAAFAKDKRRGNGLATICRPCDNARRKGPANSS